MNFDPIPAAVDPIQLHPHLPHQPPAKSSNSSSVSFAQTLAEHQMPPAQASEKHAVHDKGEQGLGRHRETQSIEGDEGQVQQAVNSPQEESPAKTKDDAPEKTPQDGLASPSLPQAEVLALRPDELVSKSVDGGGVSVDQWADGQRHQPIAAALQADPGMHAAQMSDAKLTHPAMNTSPSNQLPMNSVMSATRVDLVSSTEVMAASRSWLPADKKDSTKLHDPWVGLMSADSTTYKLTPQAVMPASPVLVAEQIKHWLVRDVQHAQLSLHGMGQEPVEVAIRVQGQMAHVVFGTDNPQARQLLEGSLRELSSLLMQDGLVLSGVSVGTSSQGQTSSRFGSSAFTQRLATSTKPDRELMATDIQAPRLSRSGLDLYV